MPHQSQPLPQRQYPYMMADGFGKRVEPTRDEIKAVKAVPTGTAFDRDRRYFLSAATDWLVIKQGDELGLERIIGVRRSSDARANEVYCKPFMQKWRTSASSHEARWSVNRRAEILRNERLYIVDCDVIWHSSGQMTEDGRRELDAHARLRGH